MQVLPARAGVTVTGRSRWTAVDGPQSTGPNFLACPRDVGPVSTGRLTTESSQSAGFSQGIVRQGLVPLEHSVSSYASGVAGAAGDRLRRC